jgi:hypothetical protein
VTPELPDERVAVPPLSIAEKLAEFGYPPIQFSAVVHSAVAAFQLNMAAEAGWPHNTAKAMHAAAEEKKDLESLVPFLEWPKLELLRPKRND